MLSMHQVVVCVSTAWLSLSIHIYAINCVCAAFRGVHQTTPNALLACSKHCAYLICCAIARRVFSLLRFARLRTGIWQCPQTPIYIPFVCVCVPCTLPSEALASALAGDVRWTDNCRVSGGGHAERVAGHCLKDGRHGADSAARNVPPILDVDYDLISVILIDAVYGCREAVQAATDFPIPGIHVDAAGCVHSRHWPAGRVHNTAASVTMHRVRHCWASSAC